MRLSSLARYLALVPIIALIGAAAPYDPVTITGRWAPLGAECTPTDGAFRITPRLLVGDEVACRLTPAKPGSSQAWTGSCADLDGESTSRVNLRQQGRRLHIVFDDGPAVEYQRCRPLRAR